jgi:hypothetical protein
MATSNWQHISYCCELMFALAPRSILDVGMGFGRWGILAREVCDIWRQRVFTEQWQVQIVGVEAYGKLVRDYHRTFYNEIIVRDAAEVLEEADRCFDLIILGDVLEHFPREEGERVLELALAKAYYTMLAVPLGEGWEQEDTYGNPYERHQSKWRPADFARLDPVCRRYFRDPWWRLHGVYLFPSTRLDTHAYWQSRSADLHAPTYPEVWNLYPECRPRSLVRTLRTFLHSHPRLEAVARAGYHGLHGLKGRLQGRPSGRPRLLRGVAVQWQVRRPDVPVLAAAPPDWFGVTTSTCSNFPNVLLAPGHDADWEALAAEIGQRGFSTVVLSGWPVGFARLARALRRADPSTRLLSHYHGSFPQNSNAYTLESFKRLLAMYRDGLIERVGFAKAGMAETLGRLGVEASYLPNRVDPPARVEHRPAGSPRKVGVFVRDLLIKNAHAQFAVAFMLPDVEVHGNLFPDLSYFPHGVRTIAHGDLPHERFLDLLAQMDLCLYVSLSECYPMLVIESLIRGVPCLTSHTHEILAYDEDLARRLIVDAPDNPAAIAEKAEAALADREALGRRCEAYALEMNRRAEAALNEFVGFPLYPRSIQGGPP